MALCHIAHPDDMRRYPDALKGRILKCMEAKGYKFNKRVGCPATSIVCYDTPGKLPANFPFPPN
jgi:hypothetical protein